MSPQAFVLQIAIELRSPPEKDKRVHKLTVHILHRRFSTRSWSGSHDKRNDDCEDSAGDHNRDVGQITKVHGSENN